MPEPIRIHADEQVGRRIVRGLRARGVDVSTTPEERLRGRDDLDQLEHARRSGRLLTRDADFLRLHAAGHRHAGIIYAAHDKSIGVVIRAAMLIVDLLDAEAMKDHIEFV